MSDQFVPVNEVKWVKTKINRTYQEGPIENHKWDYEIMLPDFLAEWDALDMWEVERFNSMRDNLKQGDILFDIGSEVGWCSVIYSKFVGAENMVLIEPTPEFFANIYQTWKANGLADPKACYLGLFSDKTITPKKVDFDNTYRSVFPSVAYAGQIIDKMKYRYIHEHANSTPQITIDDYVEKSGIVPDALTMDTEGSELLILRGAEKTLKKYQPKLWVSVHPDLGLRDYGIKATDTIKYLTDLGYKALFLATDHEQHWYFEAIK